MYIQQDLYEFEDGIDTNAIKVEMAMQCSEFLPLVESGDIDVQVDQWNGRPLLVFILPTIHNTSDAQLVLGVTVLENGEMQFNYLDNQTLLDAQAQPEEHRDLVVRVAGYSAFFVELCKDVQDEIISRTMLTKL